MSIARLRARLRPERGDSGIALIELVVSMAISLLMLTLIARMFAQVTHVASDGMSTRSATGTAATVLDEVTRVVRQGTRVSTSVSTVEGGVVAGSTSTSLSVDSLVDATVTPGQATIVPTRVVFSVDASGAMIEQRFAGTVANGYTTFATTGTSRPVGGTILTSGATAPLFVYQDASGAVVPSDTPLTTAQALSVASVTVTITAPNPVSYGSDPVQVTNEVTMPNIAIVNGGY